MSQNENVNTVEEGSVPSGTPQGNDRVRRLDAVDRPAKEKHCRIVSLFDQAGVRPFLRDDDPARRRENPLKPPSRASRYYRYVRQTIPGPVGRAVQEPTMSRVAQFALLCGALCL